MLFRNWGLMALAILVIAMANGCRPTTSRVSRANLTAVVGPRTIKAVVDNPAFIAPKENSAIITFGTHAISV